MEVADVIQVDGVGGIRSCPRTHRIVARIAEVGVHHLRVAGALAQVDAIGKGVAKAAAGNDETIGAWSGVHASPIPDLGMLYPDVLHAGAGAAGGAGESVVERQLTREALAQDGEVIVAAVVAGALETVGSMNG